MKVDTRTLSHHFQQRVCAHDIGLYEHTRPEDAAIHVALGCKVNDGVDCVLVTAVHEGRLILSLRTQSSRLSAGEVMRRLVNKLGEGGGHRAKAGGQIPLEQPGGPCVDRVQKVITRRLLRCLHVAHVRGVPLSA